MARCKCSKCKSTNIEIEKDSAINLDGDLEPHTNAKVVKCLDCKLQETKYEKATIP